MHDPARSGARGQPRWCSGVGRTRTSVPDAGADQVAGRPAQGGGPVFGLEGLVLGKIPTLLPAKCMTGEDHTRKGYPLPWEIAPAITDSRSSQPAHCHRWSGARTPAQLGASRTVIH